MYDGFHITVQGDVICSWEMANSFKSIWICLDEIFFCVEGWRFQILKVLFDCSMFYCGFLLLHQLLLLEVDYTVEFHNAKFGR